MVLIETTEFHCCRFSYGKMLDTIKNGHGEHFCRRCGKLLLITQLHDDHVRGIERDRKEYVKKLNEKRKQRQ